MHGAVILAILIIRLIAAGSGGKGGLTTNVSPAIVSFCVRLTLLMVALAVLATGAVGWGCLLLFVTYPTPLIEYVLVPSGVPLLAQLATRGLRPFGMHAENVAASIFFELRARGRWGFRLTDEWLDRASSRLFGASCSRPRGATIAALALLDAARGDLERARPLFNLGMNLRHATYTSMAFCQAWLMADAAARGDYAEVRRSAQGKRTLRARFMNLCAAHLLGAVRRAPARLIVLWLLAPGRVSNYRLLQLALAAPPPAQLPAIPRTLNGARDASVEVLATPSTGLTRARLRELSEAWQHVLDAGEVQRYFAARAEAIGGDVDVEALSARLESSVVQLLAEAYGRAPPEPVSAGSDPHLLVMASDLVRSRWLDELEALVQALPRGEARSTTNLELHIRAWAEVRYLAERCLTLFPDARGATYDAIGTGLLNHAAWLNNVELAYPLACDIFRWLLRVVPQGHDDRTLLTKNERISRSHAAAA